MLSHCTIPTSKSLASIHCVIRSRMKSSSFIISELDSIEYGSERAYPFNFLSSRSLELAMSSGICTGDPLSWILSDEMLGKAILAVKTCFWPDASYGGKISGQGEVRVGLSFVSAIYALRWRLSSSPHFDYNLARLAHYIAFQRFTRSHSVVLHHDDGAVANNPFQITPTRSAYCCECNILELLDRPLTDHTPNPISLGPDVP